MALDPARRATLFALVAKQARARRRRLLAAQEMAQIGIGYLTRVGEHFDYRQNLFPGTRWLKGQIR